MTYNPRQKSWHTLSLLQYMSGNLSVCPLPPSSMLFIVMKLSLLVYSIVGGKGALYSSDAIRYCPQNTLSAYFRAIWSRFFQGLLWWIVELLKNSGGASVQPKIPKRGQVVREHIEKENHPAVNVGNSGRNRMERKPRAWREFSKIWVCLACLERFSSFPETCCFVRYRNFSSNGKRPWTINF